MGHRFENYDYLRTLIRDEFSPVVGFILGNCRIENTDEIILTIGGINNSGNFIPRFTINYVVGGLGKEYR
ncbi:MAG: hypothetical protein EA409_12200 [Saprospirales bacterium]|nr:MAG: hypothetical protein EA409_12200 [Saprospirales bacterium]